jgi:hypothetical protein
LSFFCRAINAGDGAAAGGGASDAGPVLVGVVSVGVVTVAVVVVVVVVLHGTVIGVVPVVVPEVSTPVTVVTVRQALGSTTPATVDDVAANDAVRNPPLPALRHASSTTIAPWWRGRKRMPSKTKGRT